MHLLNDFHGVGIAFLDDFEGNARFLAEVSFLTDLFCLELDFGNVAKIDLVATYDADLELSKFPNIVKLTVEGNRRFPTFFTNVSRRKLQVVFLYFGDDLRDREVHGCEFLAVKQYMKLHFVTAMQTDLSDTGDTGESVGKRLVRVMIQIVH